MKDILQTFRYEPDGAQSLEDALFTFIKDEIAFGRLKGGDRLPTMRAIADATGTPDSLNLIHVAIAEVEGDQTWIIDATIKYGVDRHPLDTFLTQFTLKDGSYPVFEVMRLKDDKVAETAVERAKSFVGTSYDVAFLPDNGALYCTELVQVSYLTDDGSRIFPSEPMNFKNAEGEYPLYWQQLFALIGQSIPQDIPGTNPQAMARDPQLRPVNVSLY